MKNISSLLPHNDSFFQALNLYLLSNKCHIFLLCRYISGSQHRRDAVPSPCIISCNTFLETPRRKTGKKERASVPVKVITMLVYSNTGKQAVIDHWCPAVPPPQPQLINYSTWTELAAWTKQQHGQHVMGPFTFYPSIKLWQRTSWDIMLFLYWFQQWLRDMALKKPRYTEDNSFITKIDAFSHSETHNNHIFSFMLLTLETSAVLAVMRFLMSHLDRAGPLWTGRECLVRGERSIQLPAAFLRSGQGRWTRPKHNCFQSV